MHELIEKILATNLDSVSAFADVLPISLFIKDAQSRIVFMNQACERQWGMRFSDLRGSDGSQFFPPEQMAQFLAIDRLAFERGEPFDFDEVYWSESHQANRLGHTYKSPTYDAAGKPLLLICATIDITERKEAEARIRDSEQRLRTIFEAEPECVKVVGTDGELIEMNAAGLIMLEAHTLAEAKSRRLIDYVLPEYREAFASLHARVLQGDNCLLEFEIEGLHGTRRWLETHAAPMRNTDGTVGMLLGITRDITDRKRMEAQVHQLAFYDALTALPNRRLLQERLAKSIAHSKRSGNHGAVMFLDLDNFKPLNDSRGHAVGDLVLVEVAQRLQRCVRETDTVARFGGDEFVVVLDALEPDQAESMRRATMVAEKIRDALARPYLLEYADENGTLQQFEHHGGVSIGAALFLRGEASQDDILRWADLAMYQAKEAGRNAVRFYQARD
jgi:diguanylate cyclase (GGDEF)-like protein/PAS domain S-box-containing protein